MPTTTGVRTFYASEDMPKGSVVSLVSSSSTTPMEVSLTTATQNEYAGVTETSALAGELVSVRPFDLNGTYEILSTGAIALGAKVYVDPNNNDGRINDIESDAFIGRAVTIGTAVNQLITVLCQKEDKVSTLPASDISIVDAGGYYTATDVEGALQETGDSIQTIDTSLFGSKPRFDWITADYAKRTEYNGTPLGTADLGGVITADSDIPNARFFHYVLVGSEYGSYPLQWPSGVGIAGNSDQIFTYVPIKFKMDHTGIANPLLTYQNGNPTGYLNYQYNVIFHSADREIYQTGFSASAPLEQQYVIGSYEFCTIDLTNITFDVQSITIFLKFRMVTQLTEHFTIYGTGIRYPGTVWT